MGGPGLPGPEWGRGDLLTSETVMDLSCKEISHRREGQSGTIPVPDDGCTGARIRARPRRRAFGSEVGLRGARFLIRQLLITTT